MNWRFDRKKVYWIGALLVWLVSANALPAQTQNRDHSDPDPERFREQIESFIAWDRKNATPSEPIVFAGSSSIRLWQSAELFPGLPIVNRGFGGAHISDQLAFMHETALKYAPNIVVFYCGDNDVAWGKSAERTLADLKRYLSRLHYAFPDCQFVWVPIKPSLSRWQQWPEMQRCNAMVKKLCATDSRLHYADIASPMLGPDGKPLPELFVEDGLHLNANGYALWTKVVTHVLSRIIAEQADASN